MNRSRTPTRSRASTTRALLAFTVVLAAGAAHADPVKPAQTQSPGVRIGLEAVQMQAPSPTPMNYSRFPRPRADGISQTSVETRLAGRDSAVGEAGFLCGLLPHPDTSGAAAAFGHDPDGRFVGAKLKMAF